MRELILDILYIGHIVIVWTGGIYQVAHVYINQRATDITLLWVWCLLVSKVIALPRAWESKHGVWKVCHIGSLVIIGALVVGKMLYG